MSYATLALAVAFAVFAAVNVAISPVALALWRAARRDPDGARARDRAAGLFLVRFLPAVVAMPVVAGLVLPAFHIFEPRETGEVAGASLLALAAAGALLVAFGVGRGLRALHLTRCMVREWMRRAQPVQLHDSRLQAFRIESDFPVVAVVGLVRPRLLVARRVLEACTPQQMRAVIAHEAAHLASWDNLKRFAIRSCPDLLGLTPAARRMERDWSHAAEEAADDRATSAAGSAPVDLAEALLAVARLAPEQHGLGAPVSALYERAGVERRVRRLLDRGARQRRVPVWVITARTLGLTAVAAALAGLIDVRLLAGVQEFIEVVVSTLP